MHKRLRNIYVLMIFMIGISSPVSAIFQKDLNWNPFRRLSPLPLLFSIDKDRKSKKKDTKILLKTAHQTFLFKFDRKFYQKLGGPHRYKVLFLIKLNWTNYSTETSATNFIQEIFCQNYISLDYLNKEKIEAVQILTKKDQLVLNWKCK